MFDDMNEEELRAVLKKFRDARIQMATGGDVQVVVAEGRRMEFTRANSEELRNLTALAQLALDKLTNGGGIGGGRAIGVEMMG